MKRAPLGSQILLVALLSGCDQKPPPSAPASASALVREPVQSVQPAQAPSNAKREEVAALEKVIRDSTRTSAERGEALIERSKKLGLHAPEGTTAKPSPSPRVEIALPEGPPRSDPVEGGTYVLSISIDFAGGHAQQERAAATVERDGETLRIRRHEPGSEPLIATLREGRLSATGYEEGLSYRLEGQVTGPGKLAGRVTGNAPGTEIRDGRWSLERVK